MKIKTNVRAGRCATTAYDRCGGAVDRCGGSSRCGGYTRCGGGCGTTYYAV